MKFKINGMDWQIKEVSQEYLKRVVEDKENDGEYYGLCRFKTQTIYLFEDLPFQQKRKTLMHELTHCYIGSHITFTFLNNATEDVWCDIVANSHDIIHDIVEAYFYKPKVSLDEFKQKIEELCEKEKD